MGNHQSGRTMGQTAASLLKAQPNTDALELLDAICRPYQNCDAEFEAAACPESPSYQGYIFYTDPAGPLGILIARAFSPQRDWIAETAAADRVIEASDGEEDRDSMEAWLNWYAGPYAQFKERFGFD